MKILRFNELRESVNTNTSVEMKLQKGNPVKFRSDVDGEYVHAIFQKYSGSGKEAIVTVDGSIDVVMLSQLEKDI